MFSYSFPLSNPSTLDPKHKYGKEKKMTEKTKEADLEMLKSRISKALDAQYACNLSGVIHTFASDMGFLCEIDRRYIQSGTGWRNKHPLAVVWLSTAANVAGLYFGDSDNFTYSRAVRYLQGYLEGNEPLDYRKSSLYVEKFDDYVD